MVEVYSGYNTTINRFDGGVPRCKVELNASVDLEVDESFTYQGVLCRKYELALAIE